MRVSPRRFLAALFDMDGLLVDTESLYYEAAVKLCCEYGRSACHDSVVGMIGKNVMEGIKLLKAANSLDPSVEQLIDRYHVLFEELVACGIRRMPGVECVLDCCRQADLRLAVVTSTDRRRATELLFKANLADSFEQIFTADDVTHAKPAPDLYLAACRSLGVKPNQTIAFEDSLHGTRSAKTAGCFTVGVPNPFLDKRQFVDTDLCADRLDDDAVLKLLAI